jgi:hypothetical protein
MKPRFSGNGLSVGYGLHKLRRVGYETFKEFKIAHTRVSCNPGFLKYHIWHHFLVIMETSLWTRCVIRYSLLGIFYEGTSLYSILKFPVFWVAYLHVLVSRRFRYFKTFNFIVQDAQTLYLPIASKWRFQIRNIKTRDDRRQAQYFQHNTTYNWYLSTNVLSTTTGHTVRYFASRWKSWTILP